MGLWPPRVFASAKEKGQAVRGQMTRGAMVMERPDGAAGVNVKSLVGPTFFLGRCNQSPIVFRGAVPRDPMDRKDNGAPRKKKNGQSGHEGKKKKQKRQGHPRWRYLRFGQGVLEGRPPCFVRAHV